MDCSEIVLVAGEGGHHAQMLRLARLLSEEGQAVSLICEAFPAGAAAKVRVLFTGGISRASKLGKRALPVVFFSSSVLFFISLASFLRKRPAGVVFHGPLFCVPVLLATIILRIKSIYIESWSKFERPSKTCTVFSVLGVKIYYQNIELSRFFPDGVYSGRL